MDLNYRRELLGLTHTQLARLLGRSTPTIRRWCSTSLEHPAWLIEWMEYVEMELACGCQPAPVPRGGDACVRAFLHPSSVPAKRAPNGSRADMLVRRVEARKVRALKGVNARRMVLNQRPGTLKPRGIKKK